MPFSNAERQRLYRQRLKARANAANLYDVLTEYFRSGVDADGLVRRKPRSLNKLTPEELAGDICRRVYSPADAIFQLASGACPNASDEATERLRRCLETIDAIFAAPDL